MRVPTRSAGTRSGVNWIRLNSPLIACATVLTASVFARPGTPSTRRCPRASSATTMRSSRWSWPTMTFLISKIRRSIWPPGRTLVDMANSPPLVRRNAEGAARLVDGHREAHPAEHLTCRIDETGHDAHDLAVLVHQRAAGRTLVHGGVELDQSGDRLLQAGSVHGPVETGDHARRERAREIERAPDGERGIADVQQIRVAQDRDRKDLRWLERA